MIPVAALSFVVFPARSSERPNIVLISIDTLRADHVSSYGYKRQTTPNLDALASEGVRFDQVTTAANSTLPSHMSIFTSLYPDAHGVTDRDETIKPRLSTRRTTLAEHLQRAGYDTAAFVRDCVYMNPDYGFDRGFGTYQVVDADGYRTDNEAVLPWLRQNHTQPFFLFVHYYDVHSDWTKLPYESPGPYGSKFTANYDGSFTGCGDGLCATQYLEHLTKLKSKLSDKDLEYIIGLYDNGIAFVDSEIGRVLRTLDELNLRSNTIVMLVSDHGEEFREHDCLGHCTLHEETIRVPWIVSWPGTLVSRVVESPVQTLDIMPTLLQLVGLPSSTDAQGISRVNELEGTQGSPARPQFSTVAWGTEFSVRIDRWKLILDSASDRRELYDLQTDPGEKRNLANQHTELTKEMATFVEFFRADNRHALASALPIATGSLTVAEMEKQRSLGYDH